MLMKKRFIFLVMLFALLGGVNWNVLNAQEVILGENTTTYTSSIPTKTDMSYSITQQIYLSSELQDVTDEISAFAYMLQRTSIGAVRNLKVYMKNIEESSFTSTASYVMSADDLVFDGKVTYGNVEEWLEIELDETFEYDKTKNLLLAIYDYTGTGTSLVPRAYTYGTETARSIYNNGYGSAYDPSASHNCFTQNSVNKIKFIIGEDSTEPEIPEGDWGCSVEFVLNDSYGDGWNGNNLYVSYEDVTKPLTFVSGYTASHILEIPQGTHVTVTYKPEGNYQYENTFGVRYYGDTEYICTQYTITNKQIYTHEFDVNCEPSMPSVPALTATATGGSTIVLTIEGLVQKAIISTKVENCLQKV